MAGATVVSPRGRFIQWRAVLRNSTASVPRVEEVSIAYLPRNVAPEVVSVTTLPPGIRLSPIAIQAEPNIESTGLDPSLFGAGPQVPPRRTFQRGAVSLQWQAEDRNGDQLEYAVYYRGLNEQSFHLLKDKLRENYYTVDGLALGDGRYVFKVVASDAPDNPPQQALTGERLSEPMDIDNTPPVVSFLSEPHVSGDRVSVRFSVEDAASRVKRADVSVDGGAWVAVFPEDGIADSPREIYAVELPVSGGGEHTVSVRALDTSGNVGGGRITVRL